MSTPPLSPTPFPVTLNLFQGPSGRTPGAGLRGATSRHRGAAPHHTDDVACVEKWTLEAKLCKAQPRSG